MSAVLLLVALWATMQRKESFTAYYTQKPFQILLLLFFSIVVDMFVYYNFIRIFLKLKGYD